MMQNAPVRSVFSEITDFLATNPTPEEIIAYRLPDDLQTRAHALLELNGEGELTEEDRDELFDFVRVDEMMSLLKAKMKRKLNKASE
jgi:hypothetical protein